MTETAFDAAQFDDGYPVGIERNWWCSARNRIILAELARSVPKSARILEIGCGPGMVVGYLNGKGWNVTGCDLGSPRPIEGVAPFLYLGTAAQSLPYDLRMGVDCILLLDVIEHIGNVRGFLRSCFAACPNAKTAMITVPARPEAWSGHDEHYGHFRRYLPETLTADIEAAGMHIDRMRYFFHSLYVAAMAINKTGAGRQPERRAPQRPYRLLHDMVATAMVIEDRIMRPLNPRGLSLMAVARR